jgi:drug/metabolite transporter (DMT)-like permease
MYILSQFNLNSLGWGGLMALIDALILSLLKAYEVGWIKWGGVFLVAMITYAFQPIIFYQGLKGNGLTVMNLLWDVMSDVVVTGIGLFYFSEKLSKLKKAGVILSFISIILLTWKDGSE